MPINPTQRGVGFGGGMTLGEITAIDEKTITVKTRDGSSKLIVLPESAKFTTQTAATITDLKVGSNVGVMGSVNTDGSITAQTVQLNPMLPTPPPSANNI